MFHGSVVFFSYFYKYEQAFLGYFNTIRSTILSNFPLELLPFYLVRY